MQYLEIFFPVIIQNFIRIFFFYFLIFAQNIVCGYTLEPPHYNTVSLKGSNLRVCLILYRGAVSQSDMLKLKIFVDLAVYTLSKYIQDD